MERRAAAYDSTTRNYASSYLHKSPGVARHTPAYHEAMYKTPQPNLTKKMKILEAENQSNKHRLKMGVPPNISDFKVDPVSINGRKKSQLNVSSDNYNFKAPVNGQISAIKDDDLNKAKIQYNGKKSLGQNASSK